MRRRQPHPQPSLADVEHGEDTDGQHDGAERHHASVVRPFRDAQIGAERGTTGIHAMRGIQALNRAAADVERRAWLCGIVDPMTEAIQSTVSSEIANRMDDSNSTNARNRGDRVRISMLVVEVIMLVFA